MRRERIGRSPPETTDDGQDWDEIVPSPEKSAGNVGRCVSPPFPPPPL